MPSAFLEVRFSSATSAHRVHTRQGSHALAFGPPSAFRTLSTGSSSVRLAGLFHPAATRDSLFRGFPRQPAAQLVAGTFALLTFASKSCTRANPHAPDLATPPSGRYSDYRSVAHSAELLHLPTVRSPLKFSLPRVFLRPPWPRLHGACAHDLTADLSSDSGGRSSA